MKISEQEYHKLSNMPQWEEGANSYEGGMLREANPYPKDTDEWRSWDLGWDEADDVLGAQCDSEKDWDDAS